MNTKKHIAKSFKKIAFVIGGISLLTASTLLVIGCDDTFPSYGNNPYNFIKNITTYDQMQSIFNPADPTSDIDAGFILSIGTSACPYCEAEMNIKESDYKTFNSHINDIP